MSWKVTVTFDLNQSKEGASSVDTIHRTAFDESLISHKWRKGNTDTTYITTMDFSLHDAKKRVAQRIKEAKEKANTIKNGIPIQKFTVHAEFSENEDPTMEFNELSIKDYL